MARSSTINISVTPRHQRLIQAKITAGGYHTPSEVVREALRLLEERHREQKAFWAAMRRKVEVARKGVREGKGIPGNQARAEMEAYVRGNLAAKKVGRGNRNARTASR
jgi:antitoxin ParD1/3/4